MEAMIFMGSMLIALAYFWAGLEVSESYCDWLRSRGHRSPYWLIVIFAMSVVWPVGFILWKGYLCLTLTKR